MKPKRKILSIIIGTVYLFSCTKDKPEPVVPELVPIASFATDHNSYYFEGSTISLINTSENAYSYLWTLPDGRTDTAKNSQYEIPSNTGFDSLVFKLSVFSHNRILSSSAELKIEVVPVSWFSVEGFGTFVPDVFSTMKPLTHWGRNAYYNYNGIYDPNSANAMMSISILIADSIIPSDSTDYSLTAESNPPPGKGYIRIMRRWWEDNYFQFIPESGLMHVNKVYNKTHITFDEVDAKFTDNWGITHPDVKISGELIFP